jgi:hypothetical protein
MQRTEYLLESARLGFRLMEERDSAALNVMAKSGMTYLKTDRMRNVDCIFYEFAI